MKIDFIIISSILAIICFLPFILLPLLGTNEEKSIQRKFKAEALRLGLNISFELHWNTNRAGIDILKRQFLFIQKPDKDFVIKKIDLTKVDQIKMITHYVTVKQNRIRVEILSRIELEFYEDHTLTPSIVTLFDHDQNYNQDFELQNAQKLANELQKYLMDQPLLKRTA